MITTLQCYWSWPHACFSTRRGCGQSYASCPTATWRSYVSASPCPGPTTALNSRLYKRTRRTKPGVGRDSFNLHWSLCVTPTKLTVTMFKSYRIIENLWNVSERREARKTKKPVREINVKDTKLSSMSEEEQHQVMSSINLTKPSLIYQPKNWDIVIYGKKYHVLPVCKWPHPSGGVFAGSSVCHGDLWPNGQPDCKDRGADGGQGCPRTLKHWSLVNTVYQWLGSEKETSRQNSPSHMDKVPPTLPNVKVGVVQVIINGITLHLLMFTDRCWKTCGEPQCKVHILIYYFIFFYISVMLQPYTKKHAGVWLLND